MDRNFSSGQPPAYSSGQQAVVPVSPTFPAYPQSPSAYQQTSTPPAYYPASPQSPQAYQGPQQFYLQQQALPVVDPKKKLYVTLAGIFLLIAGLQSLFMASIVIFSQTMLSLFWIVAGLIAFFGGIFAFMKESRWVAIIGCICAMASIGMFALGIILGVISLILLIMGKDAYKDVDRS